jgi:hypothetical protein
LKWELLEREKEKELMLAAKKTDQESSRRPLDAVFKVESHASKPDGKPKRPSAHQRTKRWKAKMKELVSILFHFYFAHDGV